MLHRLLSILLLTTSAITIHAQTIDNKNFQLYTTKNGLSDNYITGLQQDSAGYIWISTHHGLNRFDGSRFKQFLHDDDDPNSIPDNYIFSMQLFPGNQLTLATSEDAEVISTKTLQRKRLAIPNDASLKYWSSSCRYVSRDDDGNLGVSTRTGFYIFSSMGELKKRFDYYTVKDIGKSWMMFGQRLHKFPDGNLVQQNDRGLLIYDRMKNNIGGIPGHFPALKEIIQQQSTTHDLILFVSKFSMIVFDTQKNSFELVNFRNGNRKIFPSCFNLLQEIGWQTNPTYLGQNVWAVNSRNKGFFLLQIDTATETVSCSPKRYFSDHSCNVEFSDNRGRLWVGTTEGLFMQNIQPKIINSFTIPGQENISITALLIDQNKIFAGTDEKEIFILDKKTHKIIRYLRLPITPGISNHIYYFQTISRDTLWIATTSGLMWLNSKNFSFGYVFTESMREGVFDLLFVDRDRNIWIPNNEVDNIIRYNYKKKKFDSLTAITDPMLNLNLVTSMAEDSTGNIWIGGDAISRWNRKLERIDTLIEYLPTQKNRKRGFQVMNDSHGNIWIATKDNGFTKIGDALSCVQVKPNNIAQDPNLPVFPTLLNDRIFVPTRDGIGWLNLRTLKGIVTTYSDGLPEKPVTTYYFASDRSDDSIWLACKNFICNFLPGSADKNGSFPALHVTEVVSNDTVINYPSGKVRLAHDQNTLKISFSAVNYNDPDNMRFAYRIKSKSDSNWTDAGNQPNILLTNISPGDYKLQIKAYAYDNKWPEQTTELMIIISQPFWRTWWFVSILATVIAGTAYALYQRRINQIKEKANLDKQLTEFEMKALHAQMNPHFVFNCLNSIKEMILHDEKQNASRYLSKFAQLIRTNLEESRQGFITVKQCIDHLQQYLEMEKIRFEKFDYSIEIQPELPKDAHMAPMLVQPLVENAIWHGLHKQAGERNLQIRFYRSGLQLVCEIEDNGIGFLQSQRNKLASHPTHHSLGIANIQERLTVLNEKYKMNCSLKITDRSELPGEKSSGTLAILRLNI